MRRVIVSRLTHRRAESLGSTVVDCGKKYIGNLRVYNINFRIGMQRDMLTLKFCFVCNPKLSNSRIVLCFLRHMIGSSDPQGRRGRNPSPAGL